MKIVLDIENKLDKSVIWNCVTKNIETGEVKLWKTPHGLKEYLDSADLIIGQNIIGHDAPILNNIWKTRIRLSQIFDTLIVSRLLDPSRENGHSLEAWGQTLGFRKIDYAKVWQWLMDRPQAYSGECFDLPHHGLLDEYCVRDVEVTAKLYLKLVNDLKEKQFSQESVDLEHRVAAIISEQERNGFKLDQIYTTVLLTDIKSKVAGIYERMQQRWPPVTLERFSDKTGKRLKDSVVTFNPGSRQQIGERLKELGWKPKTFTPTGHPIVDESVLDEIIKECS